MIGTVPKSGAFSVCGSDPGQNYFRALAATSVSTTTRKRSFASLKTTLELD
jgi:hypothetical protein